MNSQPSRSPDFWRCLGATVFVWSVWSALLLFAVAFVRIHGRNVPHWDDASLIPCQAGAIPMSAAWLWAAHNEHRIPLPRLLCLISSGLSGCDLRLAMLFSVLLLGAASAALLLAVRAHRGFALPTDAVVPLALLHVGQEQNLLWGFQLTLVSGPALIVLLLAALVRSRSPGALLLAAGCVPLLPLCGANTLAFAPGLAVWLIVAGLTRWSQPGNRAVAAVLLAFSILTIALVLLYFYGWPGTQRSGAAPDAFAVVLTAAQFLSTAAGPALFPAWPLVAGILAILSLATALLLTRATRLAEERVRALGLLAVLVGFAVLALGVGSGRAHLGTDVGLQIRYVTLAAPLLGLLYVAWEVYLPGRRTRLAQALLFACLVLLLVPNTLHGLALARYRSLALAAVEHDAHAGLAPRDLVRRHHRMLCGPAPEDEVITALELLRDRKLGPYE